MSSTLHQPLHQLTNQPIYLSINPPDAGATACPDVGTLAKKCDVIITMVPATAHVTGILKGNGKQDGNSVFEAAKKGALLIDCSTIDPLASKSLAEEASNAHSLEMIDAPVSGGVTGAAAGTLTFMCGGSDENIAKATPVLEVSCRS